MKWALSHKLARRSGVLAIIGMAALTMLSAAQITIPSSVLAPSTDLYSSTLGNIVVPTGGGNAANIGDPTGRNDDGFSGPMSLGFTLNFFGTNETQFFISNNGNISFGFGISAFIPTGPTGANAPIISPFFADVDTRGANSGVVHLLQSANQDIITWDHVGYFQAHDDRLNTFQLIVRGPDAIIPAGEGQIGFFYTSMQWDSTDTSQVAAIGFGDGAGNGQILEGSLRAGTAALSQNHHVWFNLDTSGTPTPVPPSEVPEPRSISLIIAGVGTLAFARKRFLIRE
jgi:hypothetical protein